MTDRVPNPPRYEARRIPREFVPHVDDNTHGCFDTFTQQFDTECLTRSPSEAVRHAKRRNQEYERGT